MVDWYYIINHQLFDVIIVAIIMEQAISFVLLCLCHQDDHHHPICICMWWSWSKWWFPDLAFSQVVRLFCQLALCSTRPPASLTLIILIKIMTMLLWWWWSCWWWSCCRSPCQHGCTGLSCDRPCQVLKHARWISLREYKKYWKSVHNRCARLIYTLW